MGVDVALFIGPKEAKKAGASTFQGLVEDLVKLKLVRGPCALVEGPQELAGEVNVPGFFSLLVSQQPNQLPNGTNVLYHGKSLAALVSALETCAANKVNVAWFAGLNDANKELKKAGLGRSFYNVDVLALSAPKPVAFTMFSEDAGDVDEDEADEEGEEARPDDEFATPILTGSVKLSRCLILAGKGGPEPHDLRGTVLSDCCRRHFGSPLQIGCTYS